jgi:hypothetical protein
VPKWFKYHKLFICSDCLHKYIVDYAALLFEGLSGQCDLCGTVSSPAFYSVLICRSKKRVLEG